MRHQKLLLFLTIPLFILTSCKKNREKLSWNTDILAPVAYGKLTIENLLNDSLFTVNPDSSIQLDFTTTLYRLDFDSIVTIPDTTITESHTLPYSAGITFNPGQTFVTQPNEIQLNIEDIELTHITLNEGKIHYRLQSNINAEVIYTYKINNAFDANGTAFSQSVTVPSANNGNSIVEGELSLNGYQIDLRGVNGNSYNLLSTHVEMKLSPNNTNSILINNQDTVYIDNTFSGMKIQYAEGYFGHRQFDIQPETKAINTLQRIVSGGIDIEQVNIDLNIINGIGADASFKLNELTAIKNTNEIQLTHALIGSQTNINRANKSGYDIIPSTFTSSITSSNSNIEAWLELLPDSIRYGLNLELNPLGNVSGHHDFINTSSPFEVRMGVNIPLNLLASSLTLIDTITLSAENLENVIKGEFKLEIENGFPLNARISLQPLSSSNELFSNTVITQAITDNSQQVLSATHSSHRIVFTPEDIDALKDDPNLLLKIIFDTPSAATAPVKIYDYHYINFVLTTEFTYEVNL